MSILLIGIYICTFAIIAHGYYKVMTGKKVNKMVINLVFIFTLIKIAESIIDLIIK